MEIIDDFLKGFLGFILAGYILEGFSRLGGNVNLGIALPEAHHVASAHFRSQIAHDQLSDDHKEQEGQDPIVEEAHNGRFLLRDHLGKFDFCFDQTADQFRIIHPARNIDLFFSILIAKESNPVLGDFHLGSFAFIHHVQKVGVTDFVDFGLEKHRADDCIDNHDQQDGRDVIQADPFRLLVRIFVFHGIHPFYNENVTVFLTL